MSPDDKRTQKKALRRDCFAAIRELDDVRKAGDSATICELLQDSPLFQNANSIGVYIAVKSEPDLSDLIWSSPEKSFSLARIGDDSTLHFHNIESKSDLVIGEFGIAEPNTATCPAIDETALDLVLVPGVGFDPETGARLGRGKGHYDRFLKKLRIARPDCPVIGVSFGIQHRDLDAEPHDQPMNGLICETGISEVK